MIPTAPLSAGNPAAGTLLVFEEIAPVVSACGRPAGVVQVLPVSTALGRSLGARSREKERERTSERDVRMWERLVLLDGWVGGCVRVCMCCE